MVSKAFDKSIDITATISLLLGYLVPLLLCCLVTVLLCSLVTLLLCYLVILFPCYLVTLLPCCLKFSLFLHDKSQFFFPDWTRFWRVWSWLNDLYYSSFFVYGNLQESALFGEFFLFDGNGTQVSFFENSAWTIPEAFYSFFWLLYFYHDFSKNVSEISGQYFYDQIFCIKR